MGLGRGKKGIFRTSEELKVSNKRMPWSQRFSRENLLGFINGLNEDKL